MPPIKSENLFKKPKSAKNRRDKTFFYQEQLDVNDPRNEFIINNLKTQQNNFFGNLLKKDSKNLLHDCEPFRTKILKARNRDLALANKFVPWLESELIDSTRSTIYLEYLENLFREEAYKRHLGERAKGGNQN